MTRRMTVAQGRANHRGQDVVVREGAAAQLIGKFAYGPFDKDLKGESVEVFLPAGTPCGRWERVATATTSRDGEHGLVDGVQDDGGRVYVSVPGRSVGRWPVRFVVSGDHSHAETGLWVVAPGTRIALFDIDGTLTTSDAEIVKEVLYDLVEERYVPRMRRGAAKVAWRWAERGHLPVYLTGRPDLIRDVTTRWLKAKKFPPGPVLLTRTLAEMVPNAAGVGAYKTRALKRLIGEAGLTVAVAYGNALTDVASYAAAGIPKSITYIVGPHAGADGTLALPSYVSHLKALEPPRAPVAPPEPRAF